LDIDVTNNHVYWADLSADGIFRKNSDGTGEVSTLYTSPGNFSPKAFALDVPNNKMYCANTQSGVDAIQMFNLDGSGLTTVSTGLADFLLGISTENIEIGTVKMYPNPAHQVLNIELANLVTSNQLAIKIINITGQTIIEKSFEVNGNTVKEAIDITRLATGTYFIEFMVGQQTVTKSFIVR